MDFLRILIEALKTFEITQLLKLKGVIFATPTDFSDDEFVNLIHSHHVEYKETCPRCKSFHIVRCGFTQKRNQRYKCYVCNRTFSTFTDTPMSYSKKSMDKWITYFKLMSTKSSIRDCAKAVNINIATAFFWRHKILKAIMTMLPDNLDGIIEINEIFLLESFKGNHSQSKNFKMDRRPRRRQLSLGEYLDSNKISVLCCNDRGGNIFTKAADRGKTRFNKMFKLLENKIPKKSILCTNNNMSYISLSKKLNCKLYKMRDAKEIKEGKYHIQNASAFGHEIKNTINEHFKGVATKYLNHYLAWFHWSAKIQSKVRDYILTDILSMVMFCCIKLPIREFAFVSSLP